jgi:AraC-like DNA-binding protein
MGSDPSGAEPYSVAVETCDLDEAREICGEQLYPWTLRVIGGPARMAGRFAFLHLDGFTVADLRYGAEIAGEYGERGSYHVSLPLAGTFSVVHHGQLINGTVRRAGVYRPVGANKLLRSSRDCHLLAVKIDRAVLEGALSALLDAPVRGPLRLGGEMDVTRAPGSSCAHLIRFLGSEIDNPNGLLRHPIVAAPIEESLLMSLLHAVGHQYRDDLRRPAAGCARRRVGRVVDAIEAEPQGPYTLAGLAAIAEVSLRCLQREFQRQYGLPPMAFLRRVRLARAHAQLLGADPAETSIADVARRWGFPRNRRFSTRYLMAYGATPAETLRTPPPRHE